MCVFVLFVRVKSFRLKNKTALIPSVILRLIPCEKTSEPLIVRFQGVQNGSSGEKWEKNVN